MNSPVIRLNKMDITMSATLRGVPKVPKSDDANISLKDIAIFLNLFLIQF